METNVRVKDADGDLREHDILLTHTEGLRVTKMAVECKDQGRKIGKKELEAFETKCRDTGIHKGVIVSSSGFAESALRKSRRTNIQCLELAKVESFPWVGVSVFIVVRREFSQIDVHAFAKTAMVLPFRIYSDIGELTMENYKNACQTAINDSPELSQLGRDEPVTVTIRWTPADSVWTIDANDVRHEVDHLDMVATFTVTDTPQPFELHEYSGDSGKMEIASANLDGIGATGKIIMLRDDESIRFAIQQRVDNDEAKDGEKP